jgi:WD40 repeat protein
MKMGAGEKGKKQVDFEREGREPWLAIRMNKVNPFFSSGFLPRIFVVMGGAFLASVGLLPSAGAADPDPRGILWSVDWSPNGKFFAVGGARVSVFDVVTLQKLPSPVLETARLATKIRWHPERNLLAVAGSAETTAVYDLIGQKKILLKTAEGARGISWNRTGELIATAGNDGSLQIWSGDGKLRHTVKPPNGKSLTGVAWNPREDKIVTVGEFITLHDGSGAVLKQMRHRPEAKGYCLLLCVEWHPSGEFFVVGDYGNTETGDAPVLQFWSRNGELVKTLPIAGGAEFRNVAWNPDGTLLASANDALRIWSKDGQLRHVGKSPDLLWGVRWDREGDRLLTSSNEGRVTLWSATAEVLKKAVETSNP